MFRKHKGDVRCIRVENKRLNKGSYGNTRTEPQETSTFEWRVVWVKVFIFKLTRNLLPKRNNDEGRDRVVGLVELRFKSMCKGISCTSKRNEIETRERVRRNVGLRIYDSLPSLIRWKTLGLEKIVVRSRLERVLKGPYCMKYHHQSEKIQIKIRFRKKFSFLE